MRWVYRLCAILVLGFGVSAAGWVLASDRSHRPGPSATEEFAFGRFECRVYLNPQPDSTGDASFGFEGSGTVTRGTDEFGQFIDLTGDASAICNSLVPGALEIAQGSGCTTSPIRSFTFIDFATVQDFQMVCSGPRSRVIHAMAEIARLMLEPSS